MADNIGFLAKVFIITASIGILLGLYMIIQQSWNICDKNRKKDNIIALGLMMLMFMAEIFTSIFTYIKLIQYLDLINR